VLKKKRRKKRDLDPPSVIVIFMTFKLSVRSFRSFIQHAALSRHRFTFAFTFVYLDESESGERAIRETLLLIARDGCNGCDNLDRTATAGARGRITASPINFL